MSDSGNNGTGEEILKEKVTNAALQRVLPRGASLTRRTPGSAACKADVFRPQQKGHIPVVQGVVAINSICLRRLPDFATSTGIGL